MRIARGADLPRSRLLPALGDYLEEGLAELGYSCDDMELSHL